MTFGTLIRRSLRFHARSHLGVVLGATIGSTTLIGALVVGDSVRETLRHRALARLGEISYAISSGDRFFLANLDERMKSGTRALAVENGRDGSLGLFPGDSSASLLLRATASKQDGTARANQVNALGVEATTWGTLAGWTKAEPKCLAERTEEWASGDMVLINEELARQLSAGVGDEIILRIQKPTALTQDAVITPRGEGAVAFRVKIGAVLPPNLLGDFTLTASQSPPANAFLPLKVLNEKLGIGGNANLALNSSVLRQTKPVSAETALGLLNSVLQQMWQLEDAQLSVRVLDQAQTATGGEYILPSIEVSSPRIFLEDRIVAAAVTPRTRLLTSHAGYESDSPNDVTSCGFVTNGVRILTYLANLIQSGDQATPYSMVTAADTPFVPRDMRIDEILINDWLAKDLGISSGDKLDLVYYAVDSASRLTERTNSFRVRGIVPMKGIYADRTLMPDFPGVAKAESTHEWDTGFPLAYKIRDKDEIYWKQYRGTPKAFITLAAGQAMWASRFGSLTAIRYTVPANSVAATYREAVYRNLLANLVPADFGFQFRPVREQALNAANQAQDFGQLFLGFSLFLVVAALLLMALLFAFGLEQRGTEVGTFLALGFTPKQVRRLLLMEGVALALLGGVLGAAGGIVYAKGMLWGLATIWHNAVAGSQLGFYASPVTLLAGLFCSTVIAVLTIWLVLHRQARRPARELLAGEMTSGARNKRSRAPWLALLSGLAAVAIISWLLITGDTANPGAFFGAGALLLISGLAIGAAWLARLERPELATQLTLSGLGVRGSVRRRKRSLATMALLASGCFVIIAIGVFRLDANQDSARRTSGTGGFAYFGESTIPIVQDLNTAGGREFFGLSSNSLAGVQFVAFRAHDGDDASCLNLNRAQRPRVLGVKPDALRGRFTFAAVAKGLDRKKGWSLLEQPAKSASSSEDEVPAIGDANSIEWALGKKIGDTIDYTDEYGHTFKLRLVAAVANSILQGSLIIDEAQLVKRFPGESGYRVFLLDAPFGWDSKLAPTLSRALQDVGFQMVSAVQRLNALNAVQNTYLGTFQILGGLGLLLGSAGLGVVVLRNVLERRGELGLMLAVGFRKRQLHWLILSEHAALLGLGLSLGLLAAAVAVFPSLLSPATRLPYGSLSLTLAAVCLNGVLWTWLATRSALSGNLLQTLRNE
jgi:ABC-type lipoprotein release transport system permease subunit